MERDLERCPVPTVQGRTARKADTRFAPASRTDESGLSYLCFVPVREALALRLAVTNSMCSQCWKLCTRGR